ncbi:hypothetical protein BH24ACT22_BH24ACT22_02790 [soil metagenome]
MSLNDALLKRLTETPGVSGREEQQREIVREELSSLTDEVRTDNMGSVIGTKKGRDDVRVMIAAHTDEIGFLVKYIDDKGFLRLQTLGRPRPGEHGLPTCPGHYNERRDAAGRITTGPQTAAPLAGRGPKASEDQ